MVKLFLIDAVRRHSRLSGSPGVSQTCWQAIPAEGGATGNARVYRSRQDDHRSI